MNGRALPTNRPTPVEHNFPIVEVFSAIFSQLCECADKRFQDYPQAHRQHLSACGTVLFEAAEMPSIGIGEYIRRIKQYSECSTECFIVSLIYIDRLIANHEGFALHSLNFHRLFLTSAMMSTKFYEDVYYNNAFWSRVGGVSLNEINAQELHFLRLIEWQFSVPKTLYDQYYTELVLFAEREGLLPDDFVPPTPHTKPPTVVSSTACFSPDLQPLDVFLPVSQDPLPSLPSASPDSELTRMLTSASHIAQKSYALAAASSAAPPTTNGVHHNHHNHHLHPQVSSAASASTSSGFPEFTSPILRSLPSRRLSQDLTILTQGPSLQHSSSATTHAAPPTATPAPLAAPTATPAPVPISNHVKPTLMVSAPTVPTSSTMPSASHPPHLAPSTYSHPHPHHPSVSAVGQTASQLQSKLVALSSTSSSSTSAHPHPAPSVSSSGMHLGSRTSAGTRSRRRRLARKKRMAAGKSSSSSSMGLSMGPNGNSSGTMPSSTSSSAAKGMETKRSADNSMMMMSSSSPARAHASGFSATAPSASSSSSAALFPTTGEMVFNSFSAHENPFEHNGFVFQPTALSSASMAQSEVSDLSARSAISEVSGDPHEGMCTPSWHGDIREGDDEYDEDDLDDESQDELAEEEEDEEESSEHELTRVHHQYHPYPQRHRRTHSEALRSSGGLGASSADLPILRSVSNSAVEGLATLAVDHPTSESEAMMDVDHHEAVLPSASTHTTAPLPLLPTVVSASNFVRPSVSIEAVGEPISATIALDHSLAHVPAVMSTELTATPLLPASTASYADPSGPLSHRSAGGSSHMMMQNSTTAGIHIHGTGAGAGAGGTGAGVVGGSDHHNPRLRSSVRRKSMSPRTPASALLFFERSPPCRRRVLKWRTKQPAYRTSTDESEASDLSSSPSPREDLKVAAAPSSSAPSGGSYHR